MSVLTHIKFGVVSRSATTERATGGNAIGLAAYHACARYETAAGKVFDFRRKLAEHVGSTQIFLPPGAPGWAAEPNELWRQAQKMEKRADSQEARWLLISAPREVRHDEYAGFAAALSQVLVHEGMSVQADCHCPRASDGDDNGHVHLLATLRRFDGDKFSTKKERAWNQLFTEDRGRVMRRRIADAANVWLSEHGYEARLDPERQTDRTIPSEVDVSRRAVEAWKRSPDSAGGDQYERVLSDRARRSRQRNELDRARAERSAAETEIADLRHVYERLLEERAPGISLADASAREERRKRHLAMLLRQHYDTSWLPPSIVHRIARVDLDRDRGRAVLHLDDGSKLVDDGSTVRIIGRATDTAILELVAAADRHGWTQQGGTGVHLFGPPNFRRLAAAEFADRVPPVTVTGLDEVDQRAVEALVEKRIEQRRQAALQALRRAEMDALEAGKTANMTVLSAIREAQAAVASGDDPTIRAVATGDMPSAMRIGQGWRLRQRQAGTLAEPMADEERSDPTMSQRYIPRWPRPKRGTK